MMLVLSRKPGERVLIGDKIQITIVRIGPNTVRLGFDAPRDVNIARQEIAALANEVAETEEALSLLLAQYEGPLESDGGPASPQVLAVTEMKTAE